MKKEEEGTEKRQKETCEIRVRGSLAAVYHSFVRARACARAWEWYRPVQLRRPLCDIGRPTTWAPALPASLLPLCLGRASSEAKGRWERRSSEDE